MLVTEYDNHMEKKIGSVISVVMSSFNIIRNPNTNAFIQILNADLKTDHKDNYYIHVDLFIKTDKFIVFNPELEGVVVNQFNKVAYSNFKMTVKVKVRDYTLIVDAGEYEILYTKKVRKKE
jgi:hypothetical protein